MLSFQMASGTIAGRRHWGDGKVYVGGSNQDSVHSIVKPEMITAVVADGCSSGFSGDSSPLTALDVQSRTVDSLNEVGAKIGARITTSVVTELVAENHALDASFAAALEQRVLERLRICIGSIFGESLLKDPLLRQSLVADHFLFTIVGFVMTPLRTLLFAAGDGIYALNGTLWGLNPEEKNHPLYVSFGAFDRAPSPQPFVRILDELPTAEVQSILIATDGADEIAKASGRTLPGSEEVVPPLIGLDREERFFADPMALNLWLRRVNREATRRNADGGFSREPGLVQDDVSLFLLRRNGGESCSTESTSDKT